MPRCQRLQPHFRLCRADAGRPCARRPPDGPLGTRRSGRWRLIQGDRVRADPLRTVINRDGASQPLDGGLRGRVRQRTSHGPLRLVGRDVNDRTRPLIGEEVIDRGVAPSHGQRDVGGDQVKNLRGRRRPETRVAEDCGVVDPPGQASVLLGALRCSLRDGCLARVAGNQLHVGVLPIKLGSDIHHDHVAVPSEPLPDGPTHALCGTSDDIRAARDQRLGLPLGIRSDSVPAGSNTELVTVAHQEVTVCV